MLVIEVDFTRDGAVVPIGGRLATLPKLENVQLRSLGRFKPA